MKVNPNHGNSLTKPQPFNPKLHILECLKCATMTYGDTCVPELKRYKFTLSENSLQCRNRAGSCERALCECDHMLGTSSKIFYGVQICYRHINHCNIW